MDDGIEFRWERCSCDQIKTPDLVRDLAIDLDVVCFQWWLVGEGPDIWEGVFWPGSGRIAIEADDDPMYSDTTGEGDAAISEALDRFVWTEEGFQCRRG